MEPDVEGDVGADMLGERSGGAVVNVVPATPTDHCPSRSALLPHAPLLKTKYTPMPMHGAPFDLVEFISPYPGWDTRRGAGVDSTKCYDAATRLCRRR